jgi:hypothetical protein
LIKVNKVKEGKWRGRERRKEGEKGEKKEEMLLFSYIMDGLLKAQLLFVFGMQLKGDIRKRGRYQKLRHQL